MTAVTHAVQRQICLQISLQSRLLIVHHIEAYVANPEANVWRLPHIKALQTRLTIAPFADRITSQTLAWVDHWIPPVAVKSTSNRPTQTRFRARS